MNGFGRSSVGRAAVVLVLAGLLLMLSVGVYFFIDRLVQPSRFGADEQENADTLRAKLTLLLAVVLSAILLIVVFVVAAYLVLRVGRAVAQPRVGGKATEYEDIWSRYRLSDAQVEAAMREEERESEPSDDDRNGGDDPSRADGDDHD